MRLEQQNNNSDILDTFYQKLGKNIYCADVKQQLHKENKYYAYSKENHWTDNIYAAGKFNTLEAAQKYAKNSLKDKLQELQYLTLDGKEASKDPIPTLTKEEAEAAYEELRQP